MHSIRHFSLILAVTVVTLLGQAPGHAQISDTTRLSVTKQVMEEIVHNQIATVRARFNSALKDTISEDQISEVMKEITDGAGAFQKQISQESKNVEGGKVYISKSQFEKSKVELHLAFDDNDQINGFVILPISDLSTEDLEASAKSITNLLQQQRFDEVDSKFNDRMKGSMPANRLEASWTHVLSHLGHFKSIKAARKDIEFESVDVRCEFENGQMTVRVAFDPFGKVSGLWMLPVAPDNNSQI